MAKLTESNNNIKKCVKCNHSELDGIGISCVAECMKYKEPCDTAIEYCGHK